VNQEQIKEAMARFRNFNVGESRELWGQDLSPATLEEAVAALDTHSPKARKLGFAVLLGHVEHQRTKRKLAKAQRDRDEARRETRSILSKPMSLHIYADWKRALEKIEVLTKSDTAGWTKAKQESIRADRAEAALEVLMEKFTQLAGGK